jgi:predicted O-methyltransferase YrrM
MISDAVRNLSLLGRLWKHKGIVRSLVDSPNFVFVSDYPPGHFYSPLPDLADIDARASTIFDRSRNRLAAIDINEHEQLTLLEAFSGPYAEMPFDAKPTPGLRYYFDNPYFSFGDGVVLYSVLRHFKPRRIIEIGSGFSSAAMLDVQELFLDPIDFLFIEPRPERLHGLLSASDRTRCRIETVDVQHVNLHRFEELEPNDILFVDSSHVGKVHSDVVHIIFDILPRLRAGVIVHFHDVPWPFEYPENWIREGRAYNEAYLLRAFLQYNQAFRILFFNSFIALHHRELMGRFLPAALRTPSTTATESNSSVWLKKST